MISASEMKKISDNAQENKKVEATKKAKKTLNKYIIPLIELAASKGMYKISYVLSGEYEMETIKTELKNCGFNVESSGVTLKVSW